MEVNIENIEKSILGDCEKLGLDLCDVEYVREGGYNFLRIYVEKIEGITSLDDCVELSQIIDKTVDKLVNEKFFLEVSTPGLDRRLKKEKDFLRFINSEIEVRTNNNVEGKKKFQGVLQEFKDNGIVILDTFIPLEKIKQAKLVFKMPFNKEDE